MHHTVSYRLKLSRVDIGLKTDISHFVHKQWKSKIELININFVWIIYSYFLGSTLIMLTLCHQFQHDEKKRKKDFASRYPILVQSSIPCSTTSLVYIYEATTNHLRKKSDRLHQYTRRNCFLLHCVESTPNDSPTDFFEKLKNS